MFESTTYRVTIRGESPIQFSRYHMTPKIDANEAPGDYDDRTWREKAHTGPNGNIIIPANALMTFIRTTAQRLGMKLKGQKTFGKVFAGGFMIVDGMDLGVTPDALKPNRVYVNSDGVRGSGKRVWRTFPMLHDWGGSFTIDVFRTEITEDILREHIEWGLAFVGMGSFRPENGNIFGRGSLVSLKNISKKVKAA